MRLCWVGGPIVSPLSEYSIREATRTRTKRRMSSAVAPPGLCAAILSPEFDNTLRIKCLLQLKQKFCVLLKLNVCLVIFAVLC